MRAKDAVYLALRVGEEMRPKHQKNESTVSFDMKTDSHVFELYMIELHKIFEELMQQGENVSQIAYMMTDPRISELIVKFGIRKVRGESIAQHELAHAIKGVINSFETNLISITPCVVNGFLTLECFNESDSENLTDEQDTPLRTSVRLAPKVPSDTDIQYAWEGIVWLAKNGQWLKALPLFCSLISKPTLKTSLVSKYQTKLLEEYKKELYQYLPLRVVDNRESTTV